MTDEQLINRVRDEGGASADEARAGLTATLEALGARLAGGSVDDLASDLPPDAAAALRRGRTPTAEPASATHIAARVAAATDTDATQASNLVQAALRAVAAAVDRERVERIRDQLPSDLARLLQRTDAGDTSAVHTGA
jgi:uncharacterized protein (DUF2267 family)